MNNEMNIDEWLGVSYPAITRVLSIDPSLDAEATELLDNLTSGLRTSEQELRLMIKGRTCIVYGAGPTLPFTPCEVLRDKSLVHVAADGAGRLFLENGLFPDVLVTDLDGGSEVIHKCAQKSIIVVHAHGNNMDKIWKLVPELLASKAKLVLTTQTAPIGKVMNFFGFTDGDRAAWLCHEFDAGEIILAGMDFDSETGRYSKPDDAWINHERKVAKLKIGKLLMKRLAREADISTAPWSSTIEGISAEVAGGGLPGSRTLDQELLKAAIGEARKGMAEGGIPIGAVLVKKGKIIGRGYNRRIQTGNRMIHAEIDCLEDALKSSGRYNVKGSVIYTTLMPCHLCAGAIIHYGISRVVAGESKTFPHAREILESEGIRVADLDLEECRFMLEDFVKKHGEYWDEDSGNQKLLGGTYE